MRTNTSAHALRTGLLAAGALLFVSATAQAQGYGPYGNDDPAYQSNENVEIAVPRYRPETDKVGAPMLKYSLSQDVSYADLNLRTIRGAEILRSRVKLTARLLCTDLDYRYPITAANSPSCVKTAMNDALYRADRVIAEARGYAANEY